MRLGWKTELFVFASMPETVSSLEADAIYSKLIGKTLFEYEGDMIIQNAVKGGARIVVVDENESLLMKCLNKRAGIRWLGNGEADIQIMKDASRADILEEAIHYQQYLTYGEDYMTDHLDEMEIEAKNKLLEIGEKEHWKQSDIDKIKAEKATHERLLKNKKKG